MDGSPRYQLGISEFTTWPWTFEQDVERFAAASVDTIEVCEFKVEMARIDEQLALIAQHGLTISSVQPSVRTLFPSRSQPNPGAIPDRMARFRQTIQAFGAAAEGLPFVTNTGVPPGGNMYEMFDIATKEYRAIVEYAAECGARVALEPLNASIMNVESAIWTLEQGMRIVEAVDRSNFGICLDIWNIWQNADILHSIRAHGPAVFVVQVSDWRTPRSHQDRLIPGDGEIPLPSYLRAIHDGGYRGPYVVEIFSGHVPDSLWEGDLNDVIRKSQEGIKRAWEQAFVLG